MYDHQAIEKKWQDLWHEKKADATSDDASKDKLYILDMFPYPSGEGLHIGHSRIYTASDVLSRMKRMQGLAVLHPMGWDAFGLPAENYAIKTGQQPKEATQKNIANSKRQMQAQAFSYDWSREINTTDPQYYKWTQWIFIQLFKKGLAYEADIPINWCPKDKTSLANEEVINGKCDRCGTEVERKQMRQWVLKITDYAERLLKDLDSLDWPANIKLMQANWIGKSEGAMLRFLLDHKPDEYVEVFTTRPDTLFGATYVVLAPEHPLVIEFTDVTHQGAVAVYVKKANKKSDLERAELQKEKTGVFTGGYVVNPVNGQKLPVWVADYVLASYGTGAIMAVPAHDARDFEFAQKYDLPIREVVKGSKEWDQPYLGDGELVNSGMFNGMGSPSARKAIVKDLQHKGLAEAKTQFKLRDWVFSRQRYWGEPIPIIHCPTCGTVPVPESDLPVVLPDVKKYEPTGTGESPLAAINGWVNTTCPTCGGHAKRETNTMPQWAGSSWYYLRFVDPHNAHTLADKQKLAEWLPVDTYIGGAEHAVLHLLYARFWHKVLFDLGLVPENEPFKTLKSVGIVSADAYKDAQGHYVHFADVTVDGNLAFHATSGEVLTAETEKMSKSKGNVINPDVLIEKYGADALRLAVMFMAPWDQMTSFNIQIMEGTTHLLRKIDALFEKNRGELEDELSQRTLDKVTLQITKDIERLHFNTAVSNLMILTNYLAEQPHAKQAHLERLALLLAPFAPHFGEEMWHRLGHHDSVLTQNWPEVNQEKIRDSHVEIVVQVNGKVRAKFAVPTDTTEADLINLAKRNAQVQKYLNHTEPAKQLAIKNRLVSFVIK